MTSRCFSGLQTTRGWVSSMTNPLGTVLIEKLQAVGCTKPGQYELAESLVRIVTAEVHSYLNGTRPAWEVIDALEKAADELRKHAKELEKQDD